MQIFNPLDNRGFLFRKFDCSSISVKTSIRSGRMEYKSQIDQSAVPKHVAFIMDGNGRWAKKRMLPRTAGHKEGVVRLSEILEECATIGVKYMTVYAFSTENWSRPKSEVDFLMKMLVEYLKKETHKLLKNNIRLNFLGFLEELPVDVKREVDQSMAKTAHCDGMVFNVALNYGGRREIIEACQSLCREYKENGKNIEDIDEDTFKAKLLTGDMPDPDLVIRTSGEMRISNYLLFQIAYSEFIFEDIAWPEYKAAIFYKNIYEYQQRERRYGKIKP